MGCEAAGIVRISPGAGVLVRDVHDLEDLLALEPAELRRFHVVLRSRPRTMVADAGGRLDQTQYVRLHLP